MNEEEERVNSRKLAMERRGWIDSKRERTKCLHCIRQLKSRVHPITRSRVSPCICFGAQKTKIRHGKEGAVAVSTGKSISPRYSSGVCRLVTAFFAAHPADGGSDVRAGKMLHSKSSLDPIFRRAVANLHSTEEEDVRIIQVDGSADPTSGGFTSHMRSFEVTAE